jgi:hypothetical protein
MATKTVVLKKPLRPANHIAPVTANKKSTKDPVIETYRALAPLRVADSDGSETTHVRQYGDYVPEAAGFKNIWVYLNTKQLELVYVNKSQLDEGMKRFWQRCEDEDADRALQQESADEERKLRARLREIEAAKGKQGPAGARPANSHFAAKPEKTRVEKIDIEIPKQPGLPQVQPLPKVTREVPIQRNVSENRTRPTKVGRTSRKV